MNTDKLIDEQGARANGSGSDAGHTSVTVKLVEMGPVSVETKGVVIGLELGYTPKS